MKPIIAVIMLLAVFGLIKKVLDRYEAVKRQEQQGANVPSAPEILPGLPPALESSLETAKKSGADGLQDFLNQYRYAIRDPRLAEIELDYVVLIGHRNPAEARQVFQSIQRRTSSSSPLYERVKKLEKAYQ